MTIDTFIEELKQSGIKFRETSENGEIRTNGDVCPICALCSIKTGLHFENAMFDAAARNIEISYNDAIEIACSADSGYKFNQSRSILRQRLLELCS